METKATSKGLRLHRTRNILPMIHDSCSFEGYDAELLMKEPEGELITKTGTLKILIPLCGTTDPVYQ